MDESLTAPFGKNDIPAWCQLLITICHKLPVQTWIGKRLAFLIRKPVLMRKQSPVDIQVQGLKLRLKPKGNLSDKRLFTTPDLLDGDEREYLASVLKPEAVVLDVGANIGGYGLLLANARPDIKLVAVEAHPELALRLQQHIDFNRMQGRCQCLQVAASPDSKTVELYLDDVNQGRNSLLVDGYIKDSTSSSIDVKGMTIGDILTVSGFAKADLLKMDIEGFEHPVLSEFFESSDKGQWPIYIQLEHEGGAGDSEAASLAMEKGYREVLRTRMNVILVRS